MHVKVGKQCPLVIEPKESCCNLNVHECNCKTIRKIRCLEDRKPKYLPRLLSYSNKKPAETFNNLWFLIQFILQDIYFQQIGFLW